MKMVPKLDWGQVAFAACVMLNLVDVMGVFFTAPVMVPYGQQIGATTAEIASFSTVRFAFAFLSLVWMPKLADTKGVKLCLIISCIGTAASYAIQGNSHYFSACEHAVYTVQEGTFNLWEGHECKILSGGSNIYLFQGNSSLAGYATGSGTLECIEDCGNKNGVYVMLAGRALDGFFGGTQPVLRAYVAAISLPNMALLKLRMTVLFASMQAGNFALSPIAGVVSQFGLHWPWYVALGVAVLVGLYVALFFKNADQLKRAVEPEIGTVEPSEAPGAGTMQDEKTPHSQKMIQEGPPIKDKILWVMLLAWYCIFQTISALTLLLPLLLEFESFGLKDPESVEKSRAKLASTTSLVMIPHGVANLVVSTVGFLIVSALIGERWTMRLGATIASAILCLYGFCSQEVWQLILIHGCSGIGIGLMVPAIMPALQRYTAAAYPKQSAQASALPLFGMQLGQIIGPMMFSAIIGEEQERLLMNIAWLVAGISFFLGAMLMDLCFTLIAQHPVSKRMDLTDEQLQTMLETNAKDEEVFINEMCKLTRSMLTKGSAEHRGVILWSGVAQRFIERAIRNSIPQLRETPQEHLEDVAAWISKVGTKEDMDWFQRKFPNIKLPGAMEP